MDKAGSAAAVSPNIRADVDGGFAVFVVVFQAIFESHTHGY